MYYVIEYRRNYATGKINKRIYGKFKHLDNAEARWQQMANMGLRVHIIEQLR